MFKRNWKDCPCTFTHGRMWDWEIFTKRKGDYPDLESGAILLNLLRFSRGVLVDGIATIPCVHQELEFLTVVRGEGFVQVGEDRRPIRDGSWVQIPPGVEHVIGNPGPEHLEMIFCRREPLDDPEAKRFVVCNWREAPPRLDAEWAGGHWNHMYKGPAVGGHGGIIQPHRVCEPHGHRPGTDEIWYLWKGQGWHWVGVELATQGPGDAIWIPPQTVHSLLNTDEEHMEYIYFSSRYHNPPPA